MSDPATREQPSPPPSAILTAGSSASAADRPPANPPPPPTLPHPVQLPISTAPSLALTTTHPHQSTPPHIAIPPVSAPGSPAGSPTTTIASGPAASSRSKPPTPSLASKRSSATARSTRDSITATDGPSTAWQGSSRSKGGPTQGSISTATGVTSASSASTIAARVGKENEPLPLNRFWLCETKTRYWIFANNQSSPHSNRVLKIDRTSAELAVIQDSVVYSSGQLSELKLMIEIGNKNVGGFERVMTFYGIAGFVRFTQGWYMILITKRQAIAIVAGHYIYHCDETILLPIAKVTPEKTAEELKQLATFQKIDLAKHFYFSYTYDLTSTLQTNLTGVRAKAPTAAGGDEHQSSFRVSTQYMWNYHLLKDAFPSLVDDPEGRSWKGNLGGQAEGGHAGATCGWVIPLVYGFVDQAKLDILGRVIYITLIGRRSRHYAGARYLRRGANDQGHVANEVETEQIVSEPLTTPFHCNPPRDPHRDGEPHSDEDPEHHAHQQRAQFPNPRFTSYVQYRGSIPLLWSQDASASNFKPPIEINNVDPFFCAGARHFNGLLEKYGGPIIVLNLVKSIESTPRESKLLHEFTQCVAYLNQFLPSDKQLVYIPWDMSRANKTPHQDTIKIMDEISEEAVAATGFFHSGRMIRDDGSVPYRDRMSLQRGVTRTNCVDCLDRTNIAQFSLGRRAFNLQLHALGVIPTPDSLSFYSDANYLFTEMYHDHGDTLALQYSGGALVNRLDTYQKDLRWSSHSRDMIENLKRFYANSMLDAEKQLATDLFLGITKESIASELSQMHRRRKDDWYDPAYLDDVVDVPSAERRMGWVISQAVDYRDDYYRPRLYTSFERHYAAKINSTMKFMSKQIGPDLDPSPFAPRQSKVRSLESRKPMNPVRRWMTSETRPSSRVVSMVSTRAEVDALNLAGQEEDHPPLDPMSTESKVLRSLDPEVDQTEVDEYSRWSASHVDELFASHTLGRPIDYDLYTQTVLLKTTASLADEITDEKADTKVYKAYAEFDVAELLKPEKQPQQQAGAKGGGWKGEEGWAFGKPVGGLGDGWAPGGQGKKRSHDMQEV